MELERGSLTSPESLPSPAGAAAPPGSRVHAPSSADAGSGWLGQRPGSGGAPAGLRLHWRGAGRGRMGSASRLPPPPSPFRLGNPPPALTLHLPRPERGAPTTRRHTQTGGLVGIGPLWVRGSRLGRGEKRGSGGRHMDVEGSVRAEPSLAAPEVAEATMIPS